MQGPIAKNTAVSSIASAAHARTLRKGSSDHLAIVVDPESQRLVNNEQADDEKGSYSFPLIQYPYAIQGMVKHYACQKISKVLIASLSLVAGHVFKSLNTSGLIPRQGKMVADRLDGIW